MNNKPKFKKNSFIDLTIRGILILIPIIGAVYLFKSLFDTLSEYIQKVIANTPLDKSWQVVVVAILAVLVILLIAYIIGLISRAPFIEHTAKKVDEFLIQNSNLYAQFKLQIDNSAQFLLEDKEPVFVRFGEAERPGFIMKPADNEGRLVVFIPKNFRNFDGNIYIVLEKNIRKYKKDDTDFIFSLEHLGSDMYIE